MGAEVAQQNRQRKASVDPDYLFVRRRDHYISRDMTRSLNHTRKHSPLYPLPAGHNGPNMAFALVPVAIVASVAFLGMSYGELVPTTETLSSTVIWQPVTVLVIAALTFVIGIRCTAPVIRDFIPDQVLAFCATFLATLVAWIAAPGFIAYGLPAIIVDRSEQIPTTHVVEVIHTEPVCGQYRGMKIKRFGAVVRSDVLGGADGAKICRIASEIWNDLLPGDELTLHGYMGSAAFHYSRITR